MPIDGFAYCGRFQGAKGPILRVCLYQHLSDVLTRPASIQSGVMLHGTLSMVIRLYINLLCIYNGAHRGSPLQRPDVVEKWQVKRNDCKDVVHDHDGGGCG